jgi:acetoin utilization protein AcuB
MNTRRDSEIKRRLAMIVSDIMTTNIVTVEPGDTLAHAANLLRQHQFHHLPVVRVVSVPDSQSGAYASRKKQLLFEGILTSQDIELAVALASQKAAGKGEGKSEQSPWQELLVDEKMQQAPFCVTPTTAVGAAAQLLVERGTNYAPVVEYDQQEGTRAFLVGLLTRSDLLLALARALGTFEPGMQVAIMLPAGSMTPLAQTLMLAANLHVPIRSIIAAPLKNGVPYTATLRIGTIHPSPLLEGLRKAGIQYVYAGPQAEREINE